ncbi:uncharacterized protein LOC129793634 [Lutzomyia longipalpis]|uniref:uncharacterized protein LOC129793634 n=1 Tax=Lutzomyia longipalpis TaxID=7200 RepID=UPI002483DCE0|nr:uncharacterized protein LOC129793634 [Lutzomyia longipalpis]
MKFFYLIFSAIFFLADPALVKCSEDCENIFHDNAYLLKLDCEAGRVDPVEYDDISDEEIYEITVDVGVSSEDQEKVAKIIRECIAQVSTQDCTKFSKIYDCYMKKKICNYYPENM